ncbi:MAG TPA: helix-turn-helix transcriptional regulator [Candidatus Nitrosotenuis sp.]|jgi:transcriptional regulator with XRE-family HTH domain|nr:helix-turn-helix transcriptional regulator [Candidatus Nitrosotenuis sp.]
MQSSLSETGKKPGLVDITDINSQAKYIDSHVGRRLRQQRSFLGLSQEKLGQAVGLTFQQVQKYERGANRIAASRLYQFSKALSVPVSFFYEGVDAALGLGEESPAFEMHPFDNAETRELIRAYYRIHNPRIRKKLLDMARLLADQQEPVVLGTGT